MAERAGSFHFHIYTLPHKSFNIHPLRLLVFSELSLGEILLYVSYGHFWNFINRFIDTVRIFLQPFFFCLISGCRDLFVSLCLVLNYFIFTAVPYSIIWSYYNLLFCFAKHLGGLHLFCKPLLISEEL